MRITFVLSIQALFLGISLTATRMHTSGAQEGYDVPAFPPHGTKQRAATLHAGRSL